MASQATQRARSSLDDTSIGNQPALPPEVKTYLGAIGRYIITQALGEGAFGLVYKAWDPNLHRWVAIKVPAFRQRQGQAVQLFLNEARAAARLRHPRIVSIYDADTQGGRPYLVSEFVDGTTLKSVLDTSKTLPPRKTIRIIYELATALQYAHRQGVVHRDIKPANIMIDSEGRPRLMDFGLAQLSTDAYEANQSGIIGTVAYMSPEQARCEHGIVASASDQYNLGVVMFECLAGTRPRKGTMAELLTQISRSPAPRLKDVKPGIPPELDRICARMLAERIEDRYMDLGSLATELSELLRAKPIPEKAPVAPRSRARYLIPVGFGVLLFLAAGISSLFLFRGKAPSPVEEGVVTAPPATPTVTPPAVATTTDPEPPPPTPQNTEPVEAAVVVTFFQPPDDPPADAFTAIAAAAPPTAPEPIVAEDLNPTYPTQYAELDQFRAQNTLQSIVSLALSRQLLEHSVGQTLPAELQPDTRKLGKIDEQTFRQVMAVSQIQQVDPHVPFALACVRQRYTTTIKDSKSILSRDALLMLAKNNQSLLFTPAYRSLIASTLVRPGRKAQEDAFALMLELATRLNQPAVWPDRAERLRTARWLGTIHGYYLGVEIPAEADKPNYRPRYFQTQQPQLEATLPAELRTAFVEAARETHAQITAIIQGNDPGLAAELNTNVKQQDAATEKINEQKQGLNSQVAGLDQQQKLIEETFKARSDELVKEAQIRETRLTQIKIQVSDLMPAFNRAQSDYIESLTDLEKLNQAATLTPDIPVDPVQLQFAQSRCDQARAQLGPLATQLQSLFREDQQRRLEITSIQLQWQRLVQEAKAAHLKVEEHSERIEGQMKKLNLSIQKSKVTGSNTKLADSKSKIQEQLKLEHWLDWSQNDAERWLIQSLLAKPKMDVGDAPANP